MQEIQYNRLSCDNKHLKELCMKQSTGVGLTQQPMPVFKDNNVTELDTQR